MREALFPRFVFGGEILRPLAVPGVAVAAFGFNFGNGVAFHAVAAGEDRAVRADFVEARPERRSIRIVDDAFVAVDFRFANAGELYGLEPIYSGVDSGDDFGGGLFDAHEQVENADAFGAAKGGEFELARGTWFEGAFVVLRTPGGEDTVHADLRRENALNAAVECFGAGFAAGFIDEAELRASANVAHELQEADHGLVVEGNVAVVTVAGWMELRPAAIWILRGEDVIESFEEGFF